MKKRARIVSGLAALAAFFLAPLAEASLTRVSAAERAIGAPALTLASPAPEPSEFSLFDGNELTDAAAESERAPSFHPLAAFSFRDERVQRELATPLEASYPKTRYRVFDFLGTPLVGVERGVTLELHWRSASFSCGFASGTVGWLSQDPLEDRDSPNLYGFVGARPHEKTDPLGLQAAGEDPIDPDYADAAGLYFGARARESEATRTVGRIAGGIATGLDIATDLGPGIGAIKGFGYFLSAWQRGDRTTLAMFGGTVAIGSAVSILARRAERLRRVGAKAVNEVEEATLAAERRAAVEVEAARSSAARRELSETLRAGGESGLATETAITHRAGNRQVLVAGQRWHLPEGISERAIPAIDSLGDQLQAAASAAAGRWNRSLLSANEVGAIQAAHAGGTPWLARVLEGQARGRWVEGQVRSQFPSLAWSRTGADVVGPNSIRYEILSGSKYNLDLHARRMSDQMFRMIGF